MLVTSLNIFISINAFYNENPTVDFSKRLFGLQTKVTLPILVILFTIFVVLNNYFIELDLKLVKIIFLVTLTNYPILFFSFLLRIQERVRSITVILMSKIIVDIFIKLYILVHSDITSIYPYLFSTVIANLITIIGIVIVMKGQIISFKKLKNQRDIIIFSINIAIKNIFQFIFTSSDKYWVALFISKAKLGLYYITYTLLMPVQVLQVAASKSFYPILVPDFKSKNTDNINNTINYWVLITGLITLLYVSNYQFILKILGKNNIEINPHYLFVLLLAYIIGMYYGLLLQVFIFLKNSKVVRNTSIISGLLSLTINILFMKKYGVVVGFIATLVSHTSLLFVILFYSIRNHLGFRININRILNHLILFGVLLFIVNQSSGFYFFLNNMIFTVSGIIYLFYNKIYRLNIYAT